MIKIIMLFGLIASSQIFAGGDRVGNGGDVILCGNKVELLDIYEARVNGHELIKPSGSNYNQMLQSVLFDHLAPIQPVRANQYLQHLETFISEARFLPGIQLNDIDDSGMVAIPKGCTLEQIIIQLSDNQRPRGQKRYTVNLNLWDKLDEFNKMSLVLHEIIYREAIEYETSNSLYVRAMVGEILKTNIDLDIYLALDSDFSHKIEFMNNTWKFCSDCKPEVMLLTNEFQEKIIKINEPGLTLNYNNQKLLVGNAQIRISDGKILEAGNLFRFLRANKEVVFHFPNFSATVTSNKDIDFLNGEFTSHKDVELAFKFIGDRNYDLDFKKVNQLKWLHTINHTFKGNFSLKFGDMIFNDDTETVLDILPADGKIQSFWQSKNTTKIQLSTGAFNCRSYKSYNSQKIYALLEDCSEQDTRFKTLINKQLVEVTLSKIAAKIYIDELGQLLMQDLPVLFHTDLYIGIDQETNADIFLEPGSYLIGMSNDFLGYNYRIMSPQYKYYLGNGLVYVY